MHILWLSLLLACGAPAGPGPATPTVSIPAIPPEATPARAVSKANHRNRPDHDSACGQVATPTHGSVCSFDTECGVCHDGSDCGIPLHVDVIADGGADCTKEDAAECEDAAPRCCAGRCVMAGY